MPKRILRSIIEYSGTPDPANLRVNFQRLKDHPLDWKPADKNIFRFIDGYFKHHLECPSMQVLVDHFTETDAIDELERLKEIQGADVYQHANFAHLLDNLVGEQNKVKAIALIKESQDIITKGVNFGVGRNQVRKEGIRDALLHLTENAFTLLPQDAQTQIRGDVRSDTKASWDDYQNAKTNKDKAWGRFTGIEKIDEICKGHRRGELWVHAGYTGELKSTFAMNWSYNLSTRYRTNVLYTSLEVPYIQARRIIHTMHSANLKWRAQGKNSLDYAKVRDGELTPEDEAFYKEVLQDFNTNPNYCAIDVWAPDHDINLDDVRAYAELMHKQKELGFLVIDHGALLEPKKKQFKDYTIALNSVLRDAKKLALHFNHGEGIPVLLLFQLSRQGKDAADKNEGKYKLNALSYANEAERSADVVTTTYLNDEHREAGTTLFCNLKNRDGALFKPFEAAVDFKCRRIYNLDNSYGPGMSADDHDTVLAAMEDQV